MSTTLTKVYKVRQGDAVILRVTIGFAQIGVTTVFLDEKMLINNHPNSLEIELNKPGESLQGKTLLCSTTVTDVRTETNETSVTYEFIGGPNTQKHTLKESVESAGAVILYTANCFFLTVPG
jgi:ATP-dependent 26S proteasome regulatory subunit